MIPRISISLIAAAFVCLVSSTPALSIELTIMNDLNIRDEGSVLQVDKAYSRESGKSPVKFEIRPGEHKRVTQGNVVSFIMTRIFPRHKLMYEIHCPKARDGQEVVTLLEIHENKLPGGCKVVRTGHRGKHSGMVWEEVENK